jgi:alpha-amylase
MKSISLALGVHNHQPVGNFDHVISEACERCYQPFFQVLERHPKVKFSVHFTGYLLSFIVANYPEIIHCLKRLADREQIELVTGGFYEPILPIIPDCDKIGQIRKLTDYLVSTFTDKGHVPTVEGMWLAERVWEPHLPKALVEAGVKYVCVDDSHFKMVGKNDDELLRTYISEEQGKALTMFPINQKLRYLIPFESPEKIIEHLHTLASADGERGAFYFDDGEKFGVWPGTHHSVYTEGWLEKFFQLLEDNSNWIKLTTFGEYRRKHKSAGRVYLPTASYSEMMEWALPAEQIELLESALHNVDDKYAKFLRGGFWRNFLVKYPESNQLHKKMLSVSSRLQKLSATNGDAKEIAQAQDKLWQGQSNDPYWHGVFGGLYLTNLRTANYQTLVAADSILDKIEADKQKAITIEQVDHDFDGQEEILVATKHASFCLAPAYGGALIEFDYKPRPFNLIDTLSRRVESYHAKLKVVVNSHEHEDGQAKTIHGQVKTKEDNLDRYLVYDWYRRLCFLDHFLADDVTLEQLSKSQYTEEGDFIVEPYRVLTVENNDKQATVKMERKGRIWRLGHGHHINVQKTYQFNSEHAQVSVSYALTNPGKEALAVKFAPELNFNFLAPDASDRYFFQLPGGQKLDEPMLSSSGVCHKASGIGIADQWLGIKLILDLGQPAEIWRYPVFTVSNSEAGFEKIYQGSGIVACFPVLLNAGQTWEVKLNLTVKGL